MHINDVENGKGYSRNNSMERHTGPRLNMKTGFIIGIPTLVRRHLYIEAESRLHMEQPIYKLLKTGPIGLKH